MATESVSEWLRRHELGDYVQTFERENINALRLLRTITNDDLLEMRIKIGDRARFRQAVAEAFGDSTHHAGHMPDRFEAEIRRRVNSLSTTFGDIADTGVSDEYRSMRVPAAESEISNIGRCLNYALTAYGYVPNVGRRTLSSLKNLLRSSWNFLTEILRNGLLWMTENWRTIAVVIGVVLIALLLIYYLPTVMSLLNTVIGNLTSSISPALVQELTSRIWSLRGIIITVVTTGTYAITSRDCKNSS